MVVMWGCFGLVEIVLSEIDLENEFQRKENLFHALQWDCFGHNSFGFEAKIMELSVLESL